MYGSKIGEDINNLNKKIKDLDPSSVDFLYGNKLFFNPVKRYFNKIKREEPFIVIVLKSLEKDGEILSRDNITLEVEINKLREVINKIKIEYNKGILLKNEINEIINGLEAENNNKIKNFYMQNVLEPLEKKLYYLKQISLIKEQSQMALEIIRRNNKEIIANLDKIKNVTITALNTAIIVAKSLYNQKIVLNKINTLENGTLNLIKGTVNVLNTEGEQIYNLATSDASEEMLKVAFKNVFETLSEVDNQNKIAIPENETKIVELKKLEDNVKE